MKLSRGLHADAYADTSYASDPQTLLICSLLSQNSPGWPSKELSHHQSLELTPISTVNSSHWWLVKSERKNSRCFPYISYALIPYTNPKPKTLKPYVYIYIYDSIPGSLLTSSKSLNTPATQSFFPYDRRPVPHSRRLKSYQC